MVAYQVRVEIEKAAEDDWLTWMISDHIPDVLGTGCFLDFYFKKLVRQPRDAEYSIYVVEWRAESLSLVDKYLKEFSPRIRGEHEEKFGGRFNAVREIYSVI